jgi:hypothetical protein
MRPHAGRRRGAGGRRGDRGALSLEMLAAVPIGLVGAILVLQVAAVLWAMVLTSQAVGHGAQAMARGLDGCGTAVGYLPGTLTATSCVATAPATVRLEVAVPDVSSLLPEFTVVREAVMS